MPTSSYRTNWNWKAYVPIFSIREAGHRKGFMMPLHQPIVEPYPDIMNINNMMTELADRAGFIDEFNEEMNKIIGFRRMTPTGWSLERNIRGKK